MEFIFDINFREGFETTLCEASKLGAQTRPILSLTFVNSKILKNFNFLDYLAEQHLYRRSSSR